MIEKREDLQEIQQIAFNREDKTISSNHPVDEWKDLIDHDKHLIWIDLCGDNIEKYESILSQTFRIHPLAIEDALIDTHVPRIDDWQNYIYLTLRCTAINTEKPPEIIIPELDVFIASNFMVTIHKKPLAEIDSLVHQCRNDLRIMEKGSANLFYQLADEMINNYMPVIESIGESIDRIEDDIFNHPRPETLNNIFTLKRTMLNLRGTFLPQREVFNKLARGDFEVVPDEQRVYFRDIYDHMVRLEELNESLRDLLSGALDTYLSVVNNRMNNVMKTLTIITTLFMPLAFITGFFGMNFFQADIISKEWTGSVTFIFVLASLILIPLIMYLWMRRKDWM